MRLCGEQYVAGAVIFSYLYFPFQADVAVLRFRAFRAVVCRGGGERGCGREHRHGLGNGQAGRFEVFLWEETGGVRA